MSYDNGPLLEVCARAAAAYDNDTVGAAARGIVEHYFDVAAPLLAQGGFPASQDADYSPDDDGDYWTWTVAEIQQALGDETATRTALLHFGLADPASAMHLDPHRHVLLRALEAPQLASQLNEQASDLQRGLADIYQKLKRVRDARPRPFVDETVYTGWSALVAAGFLAAARHLEMPEAATAALRALDRIWDTAFDPQFGLTHRLGDRAAGEYLDDHAHFAQALLDAFEYTQNRICLERAESLADYVEAHFLDPRAGAYRDRPQHAAAPTRGMAEASYSIADAPVPSGNGVMALVLLRLAALNDSAELRQRGERVLRAFAGSAPRLGSAAATYVRAVAWATLPVTTVAVVGNADAASDPLFQTALRTYRPRTIVRWLRAGAEPPPELPAELLAMMTAAAPRAYLCRGQTCVPPMDEPAQLAAALAAPHS
jgi:uncharacterized protein YyaL (SSP411 family)